MKKLLKIVVIAIPVLTLMAGIGLLGITSINEISSRQFVVGFRYYAGLHSSFDEGNPFVVTLAPMGGGYAERVECLQIKCPTKELEEIIRRYYGSGSPLAVDVNGQLTDRAVDQAANCKKEMTRLLLHYLPAKYMGYVPVDVSLDDRGQPALRIFIWLTIIGAAGSVVSVPLGLVMLARSYRDGESPVD